MYSMTLFGNALQDSLTSNATLTQMTNHNRVDAARGTTTFGIGESTPNVTAHLPFVGWRIMGSEPLVRDLPTLGGYETLVFIHCTSNDQLTTTKIADVVQSWFADYPAVLPPQVKYHSWFRNISDENLVNRDTMFLGRKKQGQQGTATFNENTDVFEEIVMVKFVWVEGNCHGRRGQGPHVPTCPLEPSDVYDIDC